MTKIGAGWAAVQERIRKSFLEVHYDQGTREQRQADEELLESIAPCKSGTELVLVSFRWPGSGLCVPNAMAAP